MWVSLGAVRAVAACALGFEDVRAIEVRQDLPSGVVGAHVALVGERTCCQIGLVSTPNGCQRLAKAFLEIHAATPGLLPGDLVDAVGEIVNIVAGCVKTRMAPSDPTLRIGLPVFVSGVLEPSGAFVTEVARLLIGDVDAHLVVARAVR